METKIQCARRVIDMTLTHPNNRGRRAKAISRMVLWQLWKRLIGRPFNIRVFRDMTFRAHPDSTEVGRFVYFGSLYEYEEMCFMERYLRPGDGFIDGGAHEGSFTLLASKLVGSTGRVDAFEPCPNFVERLRANVRSNHLTNVVVHAEGISAEPGVLPFVINGYGSHLVTKGYEAKTSNERVIDVRVVRLADALPDRPWALGKLDIEGAEMNALIGAEQLVAGADPPVWIIELIDECQERFGLSVVQFREWLNDHGFDILFYEPDFNLLLPAPNPLPYPRYNVLAVSRKHRTEVEARLLEKGT
ncbi:FkbM family methyltransferase [Nonomuraea sp. NBC_00507]|uniref:FkbM family methyltransferase n=1 Tax=Nonomuraea sp. NBC_00507 TaxID=2976002 RepID=UPI002E1941C9